MNGMENEMSKPIYDTLVQRALDHPTKTLMESHLLMEQIPVKEQHHRLAMAATADAITIREGLNDLIDEWFEDEKNLDGSYHEALVWAMEQKKIRA